MAACLSVFFLCTRFVRDAPEVFCFYLRYTFVRSENCIFKRKTLCFFYIVTKRVLKNVTELVVSSRTIKHFEGAIKQPSISARLFCANTQIHTHTKIRKSSPFNFVKN